MITVKIGSNDLLIMEFLISKIEALEACLKDVVRIRRMTGTFWAHAQCEPGPLLMFTAVEGVLMNVTYVKET